RRQHSAGNVDHGHVEPLFLEETLFLSELDHLDDSGRTGRDEINRCQLGGSNRSPHKNDNKKDAAKNCSPTHLSFSSLALCYSSDMAAKPVRSRSFFLRLRDQLPIVGLFRYIPASYQLYLHPRKCFRDGALTIQAAKHY